MCNRAVPSWTEILLQLLFIDMRSALQIHSRFGLTSIGCTAIIVCATQVFSDAYKATVTKEDGNEVEEDIYEAYNLGLVRVRDRLVKRA